MLFLIVFCYWISSLPGDVSKSNGGSVEALQEHPTDPEKVILVKVY